MSSRAPESLELARADADFTRVETSRIEIPSLSSCRNVGYDEIRELLFLECGYAGVADRVIQAVSIDGLPAGAPVHTALEDPPYTFGTARDGSGIHLAGIDDLSELTMVRVDDVSGTIAARATVPIELVDGRVREWGRAAAWRHGAWSFLAETLQVQRVDESGEIQVAGTFEPPADFSFLRLDWVGPDDLVGVGTPETDLTAPLTLLLARFDATSGRSLASPTLVARDVLLSGVLGGVIKPKVALEGDCGYGVHYPQQTGAPFVLVRVTREGEVRQVLPFAQWVSIFWLGDRYLVSGGGSGMVWVDVLTP